MNYLLHTSCCGLRELAGLQSTASAEDAVKNVARSMQPHDERPPASGYPPLQPRNRFRYIVFSGIPKNDYQRHVGDGRYEPYPQGQAYGIGNDYVEKLRDYIRKEGLGTVSETGYDLNPNSGHQLKVCVWTIDHDALDKWAKDRNIDIRALRTPATAVPGPAVLGNAVPAAGVPF
jgi:hypothetical protein